MECFGRNVSKSFVRRLERSILAAIYFTVGETVLLKNDIEWYLLMDWRHNTTTINVTTNLVVANNGNVRKTQIQLTTFNNQLNQFIDPPSTSRPTTQNILDLDRLAN